MASTKVQLPCQYTGTAAGGIKQTKTLLPSQLTGFAATKAQALQPCQKLAWQQCAATKTQPAPQQTKKCFFLGKNREMRSWVFGLQRGLDQPTMQTWRPAMLLVAKLPRHFSTWLGLQSQSSPCFSPMPVSNNLPICYCRLSYWHAIIKFLDCKHSNLFFKFYV